MPVLSLPYGALVAHSCQQGRPSPSSIRTERPPRRLSDVRDCRAAVQVRPSAGARERQLLDVQHHRRPLGKPIIERILARSGTKATTAPGTGIRSDRAPRRRTVVRANGGRLGVGTRKRGLLRRVHGLHGRVAATTDHADGGGEQPVVATGADVGNRAPAVAKFAVFRGVEANEIEAAPYHPQQATALGFGELVRVESGSATGQRTSRFSGSRRQAFNWTTTGAMFSGTSGLTAVRA